MTAHVTIVVPVYRGLTDVQSCLESVLRHGASMTTRSALLVIDDASPEADVRDYLDKFASLPAAMPIDVVRNDVNRGFVATVNAGFAAAPGDVVVLNSDTIVTAGWLDRLSAAAAEPDVATVTPLTNFGSICTLPRAVVDAFALDTDAPRIDECAEFVAEHSLTARPEVISGVGFCMYVTRAALDACGHFDEETFGLGYGEEVDFCLRAGRAGFRHLVEDSTYVYHRGGGSFGERREAAMRRASALLHGRYRFFRAANRRERAQNPLAVPFAALELGLAPRREERPHVLHVLHSPPSALGGTEKHLRTLMEALSADFDFSVIFPVDSGFALRTMWQTGRDAPTEHEFLLPGGAWQVTEMHDDVAAAALRTALDMFHFDAVHVQNLIGHSLAPLAVLDGFDGPVVCSVRDLFLACPNHSLLYRDRQACGIPEDMALCARCLPDTRGLTVEYLERFRATVRDRLGAVDHWVFATQSAADYFLRAYDVDPVRIEIIEHGAIVDLAHRAGEPDEALVFDEPLRLAFVGLGWAKKGLDVVNALADHFADGDVEVHHFGDLRERAAPAVRLHGRYDNELLPELLDRAGIQVVLLPGPYAETFGHVMTEALVSGRPVVGARYGALAERIRRHGVGWTIDPDDPQSLIDLVEHLDRAREEILRATRRAIELHIDPVAATADRYAALYRNGKGEP